MAKQMESFVEFMERHKGHADLFLMFVWYLRMREGAREIERFRREELPPELIHLVRLWESRSCWYFALSIIALVALAFLPGLLHSCNSEGLLHSIGQSLAFRFIFRAIAVLLVILATLFSALSLVLQRRRLQRRG